MVRIFLIALSLLALANPQGLVGGVIRGSGGGGGGGYSDSFTGADDTALATHDANWVSAGGYDVAYYEISGGLLQPTSDWATAGAMYDASSSDTAQVVFKSSTDAASAVSKYVAVRMSTSSRGYGAQFDNVSGTDWTRVHIRKNGLDIFSTGTGTWAYGSDHTVKITAEGTSTVTVTVWVDGTQALQITDSTDPLAAGKPGIYSIGGGSAANIRFDNFQDY